MYPMPPVRVRAAIAASPAQRDSEKVTSPDVSTFRECEVVSDVSVHDRVSSSLSGSEHPSFRALSGRLKLTARRHKFNQDYLSFVVVPRKALRGGISKSILDRFVNFWQQFPTKWLQNRPQIPKLSPGIPPRRAFCG